MTQDDADKPNNEPPAEETTTPSPPLGSDDAESASADAGDRGETPSAASEAPSEPPAEPSLEEQLASSRDATAKMKEKMLRVAADFENFRRRSSREVEDARQRGTQSAVKELLPVFDNLERATAHVDETTDAESMAKGLDMVHKQFLDVLGKMGIERVAAVGEGFDPNVHESIQYEHSSEHEAGVVMTELQPGYRMGKMLLRPALVVVSRGPAPEPAPAEDAPSDGAAEGAERPADAPADGSAQAEDEG